MCLRSKGRQRDSLSMLRQTGRNGCHRHRQPGLTVKYFCWCQIRLDIPHSFQAL